MGTLDPECDELLKFYAQKIDEHARIADACGIPRFSQSLRNELMVMIPDSQSVGLVESVVRLGDFSNLNDLTAMRHAVSRQLKARGVPGRRGKRTSPGLSEFVERVAPILLRLGMPLATSERSLLVRALRAIGDEMALPGDPRDELRRLVRLRAKEQKAAQEAAARAILAGLASRRGS